DHAESVTVTGNDGNSADVELNALDMEKRDPETVDVETSFELRVVFLDEATDDFVDFGKAHANARSEVGRIHVGIQAPFASQRAEDELHVAMAQAEFVAVFDQIIRELHVIDQPLRHVDREVDFADVSLFGDDGIDLDDFGHGITSIAC